MYSPDIHRSGSSSSSRDTRRQPNQPAGIMPAQRKESQVDSIGQNLGLAPGSFKVHQNSEMAKGAGALAYAQGNDVHFAPGQFKPETQQGRELIGHELAHVAQQREG